jgi:hypothetical protein
MKRLFIIIVFVLAHAVSKAQAKAAVWVEKYEDEYERSYYPVVNGDFSYTFKKGNYVQFTYWSNVNKYIYPYLNLNYNWRNWQISFNPLKPDIYNYKIYLTYTRSL